MAECFLDAHSEAAQLIHQCFAAIVVLLPCRLVSDLDTFPDSCRWVGGSVRGIAAIEAFAQLRD